MVYPRRLGNSSLWYTVGSCGLAIPNVIVYIYQSQTPTPSLLSQHQPSHLDNYKSDLHESLSVL